MNPYKTFNKIGKIRGLTASLIKANDGGVLSLVVKPENSDFETLQSDYDATVNMRVWSCDVAEFVNYVGVTTLPEQGDVLRVALDDGTVKDFPTTRNATTARFWDWAFSRPGYRVKFYTRFDGAVYNPTETATTQEENGDES